MPARLFWMVWGVLLSMGMTATAGEPVKETVFDVRAILDTPLNARTLKQSESNGIVTEEIMFHAERDGDKNVEIFGFFCYPKGGKHLPAFIWNQGGLYQATTYFPEFGAKRGYAALCIDFPIPGYRSTGGYPINSGLELTADPKKAPIYHGAVALLKAVSFLASRPEVDAERIGMCGSSWGGFYTTFMVGLDSRLKVGSSMFGCGGLQLGNAWWAVPPTGEPTQPAAFLEKWRTTLDPAYRLSGRKTPIAWFTGTNDNFYWMPGVMQSFERASGEKHLALLANWDHGLDSATDEEVFAWLDVHLKGAVPLLKVSPLTLEHQETNQVAKWTVTGSRPRQRAELLLSYGDTGNWRGRYWLTLPATLQGDTCTAALPAGKGICFVSGAVRDDSGFRSSTPLLRVELASGSGKTQVLPYNTCSEWGKFEAADIDFLDRHGYAHPPIVQGGHSGKQAVGLAVGQNSIGPVTLNAGVSHQVRFFLKGSQPTSVAVHLTGLPAKHSAGAPHQAAIGTNWTAVEFPVPATGNLLASLRLVIDVPQGAKLQLDDVEVRSVE